MKETTVINKISKLIEEIDYKTAYIEIQTNKDKFTLEKERQKQIIGFTPKNKERSNLI